MGGAASLELPGLEAGAEPVTTAGAKFDLSLGLIEQRGADGAPAGIEGVLEYASDLFDARRSRRWAGASFGCWRRRWPIRRGRLAHCRSWSRPSATPSCGAGTTPAIPWRIAGGCDADADRAGHPAGAVCGAGFAHAGGRGGDVRGPGAELRRARRPRQPPGASPAKPRRRPETIVGLLVERSPEMVVGLMGILKAGGAYLPLDPNYPRERLAFMLADAGAAVLVTQQALLDRLPEAASAHPVRLDADWPAIARRPDTRAAARSRSGSPGLCHLHLRLNRNTKGVVLGHAQIVASNAARSRIYAELPKPRFLLLSSIAFDSSIAGTFWSLLSGGTLVLSSDLSVDSAISAIEQHQVNCFLTVPSLYGAVIDLLKDSAQLQTIILAGEACPPHLVNQHHRIFGSVALVMNMAQRNVAFGRPHIAASSMLAAGERPDWASSSQLSSLRFGRLS